MLSSCRNLLLPWLNRQRNISSLGIQLSSKQYFVMMWVLMPVCSASSLFLSAYYSPAVLFCCRYRRYLILRIELVKIWRSSEKRYMTYNSFKYSCHTDCTEFAVLECSILYFKLDSYNSILCLRKSHPGIKYYSKLSLIWLFCRIIVLILYMF